MTECNYDCTAAEKCHQFSTHLVVDGVMGGVRTAANNVSPFLYGVRSERFGFLVDRYQRSNAEHLSRP